MLFFLSLISKKKSSYISVDLYLGAIGEYPVEIEAGGKGLASTRQISSVAGSLSEAISYEMATCSWIIERGNFLCAGYACTRGYASKLMFSFKGTSVGIILSCKLDHRTRQFLMCWLRVYAWLRIKNKVKGTSVRIVMWCKLDHRTRQFLMCWLRVYAWLRVKN